MTVPVFITDRSKAVLLQWFIYAAHGRGIYLLPFTLFTLFLEDFDYTARVQHVLHTTGCSSVEVVLDSISLSRLIRVFY